MGEPQPWIVSRLALLGKKQKDLAERLKLPGPRITELINGRRRLTVDELPAFAAFLELSVQDVIDAFSGRTAESVFTRTLVEVRGSLARGAWLPAAAWPPKGERLMPLPVPEKYRNYNVFGLDIAGDEEIYPKGTTLLCVSLKDFGGKLKTGHRVVATRSLPTGETEAFTGEYVEGESNEKWLITGATTPRHRAPIPIRGTDSDPLIYAVVIGKFSEESTE